MNFKSVGLAIVLYAGSAWACSRPSNLIEAALSKDLSKYKNISATVDDCVAVLTGQVDKLSEKMAIGRKAAKVDGVTSVANNIEVNVPVVDDDTLAANIGRSLWRDRERNFNLPAFLVSAH